MADPNTTGSAAAFLPDRLDLGSLRRAAADCTACPLHATGTQTVFGEGPADAALMLVGEAPGDQEDKAGRPFVGPSGRLLNEALEAAGLDRAVCYITNAVKHFKWEGRGQRRIPAKPNAAEMRACSPWLEAELAVVKPRVVVGLGAVAGQALFGPAFRVTKQHGTFISSPHAAHVLGTFHPSAILRSRNREEDMAKLVADLRKAASALDGAE
jgi:DNA polymerase